MGKLTRHCGQTCLLANHIQRTFCWWFWWSLVHSLVAISRGTDPYFLKCVQYGGQDFWQTNYIPHVIIYIQFLCILQFHQKLKPRTELFFFFKYTGWPRKNETAYFPQYVDVITGISNWGNFSWEKLYQDHQFWFSSLFSRTHFVRQCRDPKFPLFSLN